MRPQQQNRRMRGRNNNNNNNNNRKGPNPLTRNYESNGPDVKIRGSAQQIAEKYATLARDAHSSGDRVMAENYLQHAEHYNRIIAAAQAQMPIQHIRDVRDDLDDDGEDDLDGIGTAMPGQPANDGRPGQQWLGPAADHRRHARRGGPQPGGLAAIATRSAANARAPMAAMPAMSRTVMSKGAARDVPGAAATVPTSRKARRPAAAFRPVKRPTLPAANRQAEADGAPCGGRLGARRRRPADQPARLTGI